MKKVVKLVLALSCLLVFAGCGNDDESNQASKESSSTSQMISKESSTSKSESSESETSVTLSEKADQYVQPSSSEYVEETVTSVVEEASEPEQDPRIGQVLTSPDGNQVTVLRILPNGERVISEQTSQADYNNDSIVTFEELSRAETELAQQAEQQRQRQAEMEATEPVQGETVLITATGSKYHSQECGNGTYSQTTLSHAQELGLTPCEKCY